MATENLIYLKFANRADAIQLSTVVSLRFSFGNVRANYMSGTEIFRTGAPDYWQYQFEVLDADIPGGSTIADCIEANMIAPYITEWGDYDVCGEGCFELAEIDEDPNPDWIMSATVDAIDPALFCPTRLSPADLATLLTPLLTMETLIEAICPACECASGAIEVEDDDVDVVAAATILNFTGAGVTVTDAGGGQADIDIPGGVAGTASYAGIRALDNASSTAIAAATWGIVTECWDANTAYADSTPAFATGIITVGTTGDYEIDVDLTINGTDLNTYFFEVYLEGVATGYKGAATVGDLTRNAVTIGGIISLLAGEELSLWVTSDGGVDAVTVTQGQFCMHYLGETIGG
jgi:hypothetical protein